MGVCPSKRSRYTATEKEYKKLAHKVSLLQREIKDMMRQRDAESKGYEEAAEAFGYKEVEWKRERKKMRDEIRRLRRSLKEMEMGEEVVTVKEGSLDSAATGFLVDQMREERARRDEAVDKWKTLYMAIKAELDDLIHRTRQGGASAYYWKAEEEDFMEDIQRELKAKDETIEVLRAQLTSMEQEECRRNREVDILRQSLKIMSSKSKAAATAPKYAC